MFTGTVPHRMQPSPDGSLNLNVAEHRWKMTAGRPVEATTDDCCHAVEMLVMRDRRLKVLDVAREVGISYGSVLNILHDHLGLSKVCARWVPRLLTPVQKSFRVETCSELLAIYSANSTFCPAL